MQVLGRFWFRLYRPRPDLGLPSRRRLVVVAPVAWPSCPPRMTGPDSFIFLNEEGNLPKGWDSPGQSKLWRYNLHYFDDLRCDSVPARQWSSGDSILNFLNSYNKRITSVDS